MSERSYHHGNLRQALLDAGLAAARTSGPAALSLRELAKEVGVSPSAVYRHFPDLDHLSAEVARQARQELATSLLDAARSVFSPRPSGPGAVERFVAMGRAYVLFALEQPGLFDMAFAPSGVAPASRDDPDAWEVLNTSLDALVAAGSLSVERRRDAAIVVWSSIHGLASIVARSEWPSALDVEASIEHVIAGIGRALRLEP